MVSTSSGFVRSACLASHLRFFSYPSSVLLARPFLSRIHSNFSILGSCLRYSGEGWASSSARMHLLTLALVSLWKCGKLGVEGVKLGVSDRAPAS